MAEKVTEALGGAGLFGVEFFIADDGVYFSELSPRPHDTGMVTLAGTQNFNEFELHLRAILSLPIAEITLEKAGASAVVLASENTSSPSFSSTRPYRRMGVVLANDTLETPIEEVVERAKKAAALVTVNY